MKKANKNIKREMKKIYDKHYGWMKVNRTLKISLLNSLQENPKVTLLLKLCIAANIGIWTLVFLRICENFSF